MEARPHGDHAVVTRRARTNAAGRRNRVARPLLLVLLVALVSGIAPAPTARGDELSDAVSRQKALAARIATQRKQIARLTALQVSARGDIADARKALSAVNADLAAVKLKVARLQDAIAVIRTNYAGLVAQLADLDRQVVAIQGEETAKAAELASRKAILAERLRAAYDADRTSLFEMLLSAESFTDVVAEVGYHLDFGEQDKALAQQISLDQETLATLHRSLSETRAATEELRVATAGQQAQVAARIADLDDARDRLKRLEADTATQLAVQRRAYDRLAQGKAALAKAIAKDQAAQDALQRRIDGLVRARSARGNVPSAFNGSFIWPISGVVTQEFGCTGFAWEPPLGDCAHFHRGIDIATAKYTPIRAAGDGTVVFAGPNPYDPYPKAWIVIIAHSRNLLTWYSHVDDRVRPPVVRAGQVVRQGDIIAFEGETGRVTGPHLDWRVELNGTFVNPRLFV